VKTAVWLQQAVLFQAKSNVKDLMPNSDPGIPASLSDRSHIATAREKTRIGLNGDRDPVDPY
jgi:hypothetical protein